MWSVYPDGTLKLARAGSEPEAFIYCAPAIGGCAVPPIGIPLTVTVMPDSPASTLTYVVAGAPQRCVVTMCWE